MAPHMEARAIRKIEFLKLSDTQVLVVLVMSNNDIENRMITMDREISSSELQQSSNYLNEILSRQRSDSGTCSFTK